MHAPTHSQLTQLDRPRTTHSTSGSETATATGHSPRIDRRTPSHWDTREEERDEGGRAQETVIRRSRRCAACGGRVRSASAELDDDGTSDGFGGSKRATKRSRRAGGALMMALGTLGLLCAPTGAQAGPLPLETAPSLLSSRPASTFDSRPTSPTTTPTPRPRPTLRRRIVPMLSWSDGDWVEDYGWTRWGLKPTSTPAVEGEDEEGHVTDGDGDAELQYAPATAMGDAVASTTSSSALSAASASATPSPTATSTPSSTPTLPFRARYSARIPPGWTPQERETNYYAVPIIIAMSVLVAVIVVASIVISVVVRRRKKRRREKRRERRRARKEGAGGGEGEPVEEEKQPQTREREKGWRGVVGRVEDGLRRRNKGKKKARQEGGEREDDGGEEAPPASARRRIVRTTGFAAGDRVRPRRRRRRAAGGGDDDEDDEGTALTRTGTSSTTSSIVNDTLTARVAARLRRQDSAGSAARRSGGVGTTTVFSRDVNAQSAVSLTASALSRVSSRDSGSSRRLPASSAGADQPTILFTPADDATLPAHLPLPGTSAPPSPSLSHALTPALSRTLQPQPPIPSSPPTPTASPATTDPSTSAFYRSLIVSDDSLPAPGPPAYRPSGSTVQATRRFGAGDAGAGVGQHGRVRRVFGRRERERSGGAREEDEGEWYWPGEKGRMPFVAGESSTSATALAAPPESAPASTVPDEDDLPVDRSLFTAHVATDDKAVLARLRAQRDVVLVDEGAGAVAGPSGALPEPSAPTPEEDEDPEVDADGFERYDLAEVGASPFEGDLTPVASSSSTLLPAPPQRVHQPSLGARSGSSIPLLSSTSTASTPLNSPFLPPSSSSTEKAALADSYAAAEEGEDDALPLYLAGSGQSGAREALAMASAPPGSDEDEDEEGWAREVVRIEGGREEEGIV
ncbi:hypothetical protein NBRC10512_008233 [Rhodotorula toruloides]|uniref:RHTO0S16e02146g1_1 n=2 Tax=Rhodotorula toruloides TaxID=5286 RepID=A0A061BDX4_RHOTO|nr:uncharacterized protein RHTO_02249 [Rhodotorula toruloides NP11]EMS20902.1 hypothetical protein RHTO_02249 [Rhodotorula toruloides NP11]CDR48141.1 RHTO0S16e02146g1_1 [Rhodotorula toruloides]